MTCPPASVQYRSRKWPRDVGFTQLVKSMGPFEGQKRYSPRCCLGTKRIDVIGDPSLAASLSSYARGRFGGRGSHSR
jgi:hypothetical protein